MPRRAILFLSAAPRSAGHVYRVEHAMAALAARGWHTVCLPLDAPSAAVEATRSDAVVVFRALHNEAFASVRAATRERGIPLVFEIDDLLFDSGVMLAGHMAFLDQLPAERQQRWILDASLYRQALAACDACVVTTGALAAAAGAVVPRVLIVPNGIDAQMIAAADAARVSPKPSAGDGCLRLGFAAGTPTHHRDFTTIAPFVARLLGRRPDVRLVVVGHLDVGAIADLTPCLRQIEVRSAVPLPALHEELARFDINLAPLETGNPFCEAKSAIRCTAAALVACPSVVAATGALIESIVEGETGFVARDGATWTAAVEALLDNPARRLAMGQAARADTIARFGPAIQEERFAGAYSAILAAVPMAAG